MSPKSHYIFCVFERWKVDRVQEMSSFSCSIPSSEAIALKPASPDHHFWRNCETDALLAPDLLIAFWA